MLGSLTLLFWLTTAFASDVELAMGEEVLFDDTSLDR